MSDAGIYEAILEAKNNGTPLVLATVIRTRGAVPRHAGSKMIVYPDGKIRGTIGGGEMENRVIRMAGEILAENVPQVLSYQLNDPAKGDPGVCGGQMEIYMEPILPEPTVLVIGCGHVGQAVADLAHWLGFHVIVTDDRAELCNPEIIPHADAYHVLEPLQIASAIAIHGRTYIAAVTRNVKLDAELLPALLDTPAAYIGLIGSRKRWATTIEMLSEQGIKAEDLQSIHAPIGLELNAETPREIAVSIMGEIIMHMRNGTGEPMKWHGTNTSQSE